MSIFASLGKAALRHYRDPLSWAGIIAAVGAACHFTIDPAMVQPLEAVLGGIVSILLVAADGRSNPNTDPATGAVSVREPAPEPTGTGPAHDDVPAGTGPDLRPSVTNIPVRRIGPDHGGNS